MAHARDNGKQLGAAGNRPYLRKSGNCIAPCEQIRNRRPAPDRPHFGSPDSGLTYFCEE